MDHVPNVITLLRLALVPGIAFCLVNEDYGVGAALFLVAALSDLVDGYLARRFQVESKLGALLDPVADKLNMLVATVFLAWQDLVPMWLAIAVVARDIVIVSGAIGYRLMRGDITINPSRLGKVNTFVEFAALLAVLAVAAGWIAGGAWLGLLFAVVLTTVLASLAQYVWVWGRAALSK